MAKTPPLPKPPKPPKPPNPAKAVLAAPRLRPISTRNYGKGGTTYSADPFPQLSERGAGVGYGGPKEE